MKYTFKISRWIACLAIFIALIGASNPCLAQKKDKNQQSNAKREEIQRYVGYETLLYRYLSLPYDVTMNRNERGAGFLDIGYLLLMFLPILVMIRFRHRRSILIGIPLLMLALLIISTSNGFIFDYGENGKITMQNNNEGDGYYVIDNSHSLLERIPRALYNLNNTLYKPFKAVGKAISGDKDAITYPLIVTVFLIFVWILLALSKTSQKTNRLFITFTFFLFAFYWFLLSPGIVWYGFAGIILGYITLVGLLRSNQQADKVELFGIYSFYGLAGLWLIMGLAHRISNINPANPPALKGKTMLNPAFLKYATNDMNEDEVIDAFYPGMSSVIDVINQDKDALVYRIGTSFSYFIDDNHERVFVDNQLSFFNNLQKKFKNKEELAKALLASDFHYIIIDLNTPTIDNTPEKTLVNKYKRLIAFVHNNPRLELMATNRVVTKDDEKRPKETLYYDMFGSKVVNNGTFAVYKIK